MPRTKDPNRLDPKIVEAYQRGYRDGLAQIALDPAVGKSVGVAACAACAALVGLTQMALRHVRITSHDAGKSIFAKAGISTERWPAHYVLHTSHNYALPADYLSGLLDKVHAVEEGRLRPSPDTYPG